VRVLIADDDPVSRHMLQVSLYKAGYEVISACDGEEAFRLLERTDCPRLAILDWMMPGKDGIEICREIRKRGPESYVYMILLTAKGQQAEVIEGLDAGADDYLTKPFDLHELKARLRVGKRLIELQEQLVSAREQLRIEATHDSLTSVWNHKAILEIAERELIRSKREGSPLAVIMGDLDYFKLVNDTYGHAVGDIVLRETARRMSAVVRPYDSIGRYGGEEFLIVTPGCGLRDTTQLAERLRKSICEEAIGQSVPGLTVTMSFGVADGAEFEQGEQLVRAADSALYSAKNSGRNRVKTALASKPL
jgi:two-component system, cell cycle response regulator